MKLSVSETVNSIDIKVQKLITSSTTLKDQNENYEFLFGDDNSSDLNNEEITKIKNELNSKQIKLCIKTIIGVFAQCKCDDHFTYKKCM